MRPTISTLSYFTARAPTKTTAWKRAPCTRLFGDKAPAASLKRAVGHQLAGAGAFAGAVACLLISDTLRTGETTLPLNTPAELPLDLTLAPLALVRSPERRHCRRVLVNAFAFGGSNISLVFEAVDDVKEAKHR